MKSYSKIVDFLPRFSLYAVLIGGVFLFAFLLIRFSLPYALLWAFCPLVFGLILILLRKPEWALLGVFVVNYFIMGLTRYMEGLSGGITMDICLFLILALLLFRKLGPPIQLNKLPQPFTAFTTIWLIYCLLLVFHPDVTFSSWSAGVRGLAVYLFLFPILVSFLFGEYKYLKFFLYLWSVLTLLAVFKALGQKYIGFDPIENYWLHVIGGARTHIIYTGIRYFSFFTDAASFGSSMGLSMTVFAICSFYLKKKYLRFYFLLVAFAAGYGLIISGTRAAIAIPFVGFFTYLLLSKQWKIFIPGLFCLFFIFAFFRFTYIGNGNIHIFRIRSAFHATQDGSFQVRQKNQQKMWTFMKDKPFGIGIGKAKRAEPGDYMYQLPTDSSFVYIWTETGLVGLFLFLSIFLWVLIRGSYDVLFRIKNHQLRGIITAFVAGIAGMLVCSYGNEMLQQFPNGPIVYTLMAFVMLGTRFDQELAKYEKE